MLEGILLGYLMEGDMSGYQIKKWMSHGTAHFCDASFGSIYPALRRLEKQGLVCSGTQQEAGRTRIVYALSEAGRHAFFRWIREPAPMGNVGHAHLMKTFFYNHLPPHEAAELLRRNIKEAERQLAVLSELQLVISDGADAFKLGTLQYGKQYYHMLADWYRAFAEEIEQREKGGDKDDRE